MTHTRGEGTHPALHTHYVLTRLVGMDLGGQGWPRGGDGASIFPQRFQQLTPGHIHLPYNYVHLPLLPYKSPPLDGAELTRSGFPQETLCGVERRGPQENAPQLLLHHTSEF